MAALQVEGELVVGAGGVEEQLELEDELEEVDEQLVVQQLEEQVGEQVE